MKSQHSRWFVRLVAAALIAAGMWLAAAPASAAVTVSSFTATGTAQQILLEWTTASELDNLGFNILRSTAANGNYAAINDDLIFSECLGCIGGASYAYADTSVVAGQTYFYQLESVSFNDVTELFGPVSATAGPAPTPSPTPTPTPTYTASPTETPQADSATSTPTPTPTSTGDLPASPTASATATPATAPTPTSLALLAPLPTASLAPTPIVTLPAGPSPSPRPTRATSLGFGPMAVTPQANAAGFDSADAMTESRNRARLLVLAAAFGLGLLIEWALIVGLYGVWRFRAGD